MRSMAKLFILAAIFFTIIYTSYAKVLFEKTLEEFGYEGFVVDTDSAEQCKEFAVVLENTNGYGFVTLVASFAPNNIGSANIECFFNNVALEKAYAKDFDCNSGFCKYYVPIESSLLKKENILKICLRPSKSIVKITLSNKSKVGTYSMGVFEKQNFRKCIVAGKECVENYKAVLGEDVQVKIILKNSGNEDTDVLVYAIRPVVPEDETKKELGNVTFRETVGAGELKELYYTVRVKELIVFNLPPAALYYADAFGRRIQIFSNPITITPNEKPDVNAILLPKDEFDGKLSVEVAVSNSSGVELNNVEVMLSGDGIKASPEKQIFSIAPRDSKIAKFTIEKNTAEEVSCLVRINDYNMAIGCNSIVLSKKETNIIPFVVAGLLVLIGAAVVFFYLHSLPEE